MNKYEFPEYSENILTQSTYLSPNTYTRNEIGRLKTELEKLFQEKIGAVNESRREKRTKVVFIIPQIYEFEIIEVLCFSSE